MKNILKQSEWTKVDGKDQRDEIRPMYIEMDQIDRSEPNGLQWTGRTELDGRGLYRPKWTERTELDRSGTNGPNWTELDQNGPKCFFIDLEYHVNCSS